MIGVIFSVIGEILWLIWSIRHISYPGAVLVLAGVGIYSTIFNYFHHHFIHRNSRIGYSIISALFSLSFLLYFYSSWHEFPIDLCKAAVLGTISFFLFWQICVCVERYIIEHQVSQIYYDPDRKHSRAVFAGSFGIIAVVYLIYLFFVSYPANAYSDAWRITQCFTGYYSNHTTVYHTYIIKACIEIGKKLFGNNTAGIATFNVVQILFMAFCFAYIIALLYKMHAPKWILIAVLLYYAIIPYHIFYSTSVNQNAMFGAATVLLTALLVQIMNSRESCRQIRLLAVGYFIISICFCLFRTNAYYAYCLFVFCLVLCLARLFICSHKSGKCSRWTLYKYFGLLTLSLVVVGICSILRGPMIRHLNVRQVDTVESLSIPIQQIARTIYDGKELSEEQRELLNNVVDLDQIPATYTSWISDPMKDLIRDRGNQDYISQHAGEFLHLWVILGFQYPGEYAKAWVDQTAGYWSLNTCSIDYYQDKVFTLEDYNIKGNIRSAFLNSVWDEYTYMFNHVYFLRLFLCVGIQVWLMLILFFVNTLNHKNILWLIPILGLWITLLIAVPVADELVYAYGILVTMPLAVIAVHVGQKN